MWPFRKKAVDPVVEEYLAGRSRAKPGSRTPIDSLKLVVLDAETTGLVVDHDKILSLAAAEVEGGRMHLARMRSWLVYQSKACANDAVAVHGITPAETARGDPERQVIGEVMRLLSGAVLVGHHIGFDAAVIDVAMRKHFKTRLYNPMIDTALLAMGELEAFRRTGYANQRPPGLEELCAHCGIPMMERHTAEGDVFTTTELFLVLCARRRKRMGRPIEWRDMPVHRH
jgi:DNA polymerase-3 subunit epsilon